MVKFKLMYDKDKETEWLNQMVAEGYALTGFFCGFYSFDKCQPGEYVYQVDFRKGFFCVDNDYREFMREAGVEIVCCWGFWVILRRKASEGPFELYTDVESTIEHYTTIRKMFKVAIAIEMLCLFLETFVAVTGNMLAGIFVFLIAAIILPLVKEIIRINDILRELKSRLGQVEESCGEKRKVSLFLSIGLLCNGIAVLLQFLVENSVLDFVCGVMQGMAVILMVAGIYDTFRRKE